MALNGCLNMLQPGDTVEAIGSYKYVERYDNYQVEVEEVTNHKRIGFDGPADPVDAIRALLNSKLIKGVGPKMVQTLLNRFGEDTMNVLRGGGDDSDLLALPGMGAATLARIRKSLEVYDSGPEPGYLKWASEIGLSAQQASVLWDKLGGGAKAAVLRDPWVLPAHLPEMRFREVEDIARRVDTSGTADRSVGRGKAAVLMALQSAANFGHCFGAKEAIILETQRTLFTPNLPSTEARALARVAINKLIKDGTIHQDMAPGSQRSDKQLYLLQLRRDEESVAYSIRRRFPKRGSKLFASTPELVALAGVQDANAPSDLSPEQWRAVLAAMAQSRNFVPGLLGRVLCLTGGPGTGKTYTVRRIVEGWKSQGLKVLMACPTARAAAVLADSVGSSASTIHRLLEYNPHEDAWKRNAGNPLEAQAVVIDEASMIDVSLASKFLEALPETCVVLFVGDPDQLPSVGPGTVLKDMLRSDRVPRVELNTVFRQDPAGDIARNAAFIKANHFPVHWRKVAAEELHMEAQARSGVAARPTGCVFVEANGEREAADIICGTVQRWLASTGYSARDEVQVLSPLKRGSAGTIELNERLRGLSSAHASRGEASLGGAATCEVGEGASPHAVAVSMGDPIIQLKNDYENQVFNGDIGEVIRVRRLPGKRPSFTFRVRFDVRSGRGSGEPVEVDYTKSALESTVTLAYALTVHKAQGSEYPVVVMPLLTGHGYMLYRNLMYTGFSRAKSLLVLVGEWKALGNAVAYIGPANRQTLLHERISIDDFAPAVTKFV